MLLPEPEARFLGAGSCALLSVSVWMRFFLTVPMYKINPFFARSLFMRNQYWENKHYAYFCNRECEYFPCHKGADPENFIAYSAIALCMYWEIARRKVCLPSQRIQGLQPLSVSPSAGELWCNYGTLWRNPCGNSISRSGG